MRRCTFIFALFVLAAGLTACVSSSGKKAAEDPYAEYVWPPPPDTPRIRLVDILSGRADVEARSSFQRALIGAGPKSPYDRLGKPFAVALDAQGRVLVTDTQLGALVRFDRSNRRYDVLGTTGPVRLKLPLGIGLGPRGTIYVADAGLAEVVAYAPDGKLKGVYGSNGELVNPTDAAVSADGSRLFVADSKAQRIVVFELATGKRLGAFGERGEGPGQFAFPTSLTFGPGGNLYVVDQLNARVQVLTGEGEYLDEFGGLGTGFGNFVRPKDVAVDRFGVIYVTDAALNNVQLFDADFQLLTFIGAGGRGPGEFQIASGVAVRGDEIAVVDELNRRVQIFRYLHPRNGE